MLIMFFCIILNLTLSVLFIYIELEIKYEHILSHFHSNRIWHQLLKFRKALSLPVIIYTEWILYGNKIKKTNFVQCTSWFKKSEGEKR